MIMLQNRVVAIHQPNFFPWLGYFNKIALSDVFVLLDNVQFPKTGGTWSNRVQLMVNGEAAWVTVPVLRAFHGVRNIDEMQIDNAKPWRGKLLKTIEANYARAPFFAAIFPILGEMIKNPTDLLAEYNLSALHSLAKLLELPKSRLILSSSLDAAGDATDLLVSIVKAVGGTAYLCGGGSAGYQEDRQFAEAGIELIYQNFEHPRYRQLKTQEFVAGLSVIDSLMNCGLEKTKLMIHGCSFQDESP